MPSLSTCMKRVPWQGIDTPYSLRKDIASSSCYPSPAGTGRARPGLAGGTWACSEVGVCDWGRTIALAFGASRAGDPREQFHHVGRRAPSSASWRARGWIGNSK